MLIMAVTVISGCSGDDNTDNSDPEPTARYDASGNWDVEEQFEVGSLPQNCQYMIDELQKLGIMKATLNIEQDGTNFTGHIHYTTGEHESICGTIDNNKYTASGNHQIIIDNLIVNGAWEINVLLSNEYFGSGNIKYHMTINGQNFECNTFSNTITIWKEDIQNPILMIEPDVEYDFGTIEYGNNAKQVFTITNRGHSEYGNLLELDITLNSPQFYYDTNYTNEHNEICDEYGHSLNPGQSCKFQVIYEPNTWPSEDFAELIIESNDPNNSETIINLSGAATNQLPILQVEVEDECDPYEETWKQLICMCFEDQLQCTESDPKYITIFNQGTIDLEINMAIGNEVNFSIYLPDNTSLFSYGYSEGYSIKLYPEENIVLKVVCHPVNSEKTWECLEIKTNDPNHEQEVVRLQGFGI